MRVTTNLLMVGVVSFALAGCLVAGPNYVVQDAPKKAGKAAPDAKKLSLADEARARLHGECLSEHGSLLRADEKIAKQCDCFADTVVKSMGRDDQEFYSQYGVVPTLSSARPDEVKKKCGIAVIDRTGSRGKPPPPQVY